MQGKNVKMDRILLKISLENCVKHVEDCVKHLGQKKVNFELVQISFIKNVVFKPNLLVL